MPSQDKLIKQGIKYTDKLFAEISKRLEAGVMSSDTLEAFLEKTKEYTTANPLVSSGYDEAMLKLILSETNNHKFSRPSQRELVRVTIENRVGDLIQDVGEDIKQNVRDIAKAEYTKGSNPQKIAKQITEKVDGIKNKRARTIARTEVARASTVSDYVINKERGATGFTVSCRSTRCAKCKEAFCNDSATGGDVEYSMDDVSVLPPLHPNCRCSVEFIFDRDKFKGKVSTQKPTTTTVQTPTNSITDNLTEDELKRYNKFQKDLEKATKMLDKLADDNPRRIMYESRIKSAQREIKKLEEIASDSTNRKVVEEHIIQKGGKKNNDLDYEKITSNEDIASYFGLTYIEETTSQYGKTTSIPIFRDEKYNVDFIGMQKFDVSETKEVLRCYDKSHPLLKKSTNSIHLDPDTSNRDLGVCYTSANEVTIFSHKRDLDSNTINSTVDHEMTHAFDNVLGSTFDKYHSQESKEYRKIVREEGWSSLYSYSTRGSTRIAEDIAEAGSMVLNKNDPNVRIKMPDGSIITAKEWCKRFPKKTAYFEKLLNSKEAKELLR